MLDVEIEKNYNNDQAVSHIKVIVDRIASRFTKTYSYICNEKMEQEGYFKY
jgi:hypothetical protein